MTCSYVLPLRSLVLLAGTLALSGAAHADESIWLDVTLPNGDASIVVPVGGTFQARVAVTSGSPIAFNAALFRLLFTVEGCGVIEYDWQPPFVTGGATDFSLAGLSLPLVVTDATLAGPGYPSSTADVEFGTFDFFLASQGGALVDLLLHAPADARPGSTFQVLAYPDLFSDGFDGIPVEVGLLLTVEIANSGVFADFTGDGVVDSADLAVLLGAWGASGPADLDEDGMVDATDLAILLGAWTA